MKIVNVGNTYEIYSDDLKTFDHLPAQEYQVTFNKMTGFSLVAKSPHEIVEEKIYGNQEEKVSKVIRAYDMMKRSLGVMLSGGKGMGKTLFVQLLAKEALKRQMPVIIVKEAYFGISEFIDSIDQECIVLFDEFEKVFAERDHQEPQAKLLGLFDGMSSKKRIYAVTVNDLGRVNSYMVNRTGRFHYHLRFTHPTSSEVELYLADKVLPEYQEQISKVLAFHARVPMTFDSLRSIVFELNMGESFQSAINDLNILNEGDESYEIHRVLADGALEKLATRHINFFSTTTNTIKFDHAFRDSEGKHSWVETEFPIDKAKQRGDDFLIEKEYIKTNYQYVEDEKDGQKIPQFDILLRKVKANTYGYNLNAL